MDGKGCGGLGVWDEGGLGWLVGYTWDAVVCAGLRWLTDGCMAFIDTPNLFDVVGILKRLFESVIMTWTCDNCILLVYNVGEDRDGAGCCSSSLRSSL